MNEPREGGGIHRRDHNRAVIIAVCCITRTTAMARTSALVRSATPQTCQSARRNDRYGVQD